jgi:hypothetical protein
MKSIFSERKREENTIEKAVRHWKKRSDFFGALSQKEHEKCMFM